MVISPTIVKPACVVMVSMVVAGEVFILDAGMEVDDNDENGDNGWKQEEDSRRGEAMR